MIDTVKISKALSDPIRFRILLLLMNHERGELQGFCCNSPEEGVCNCDIVTAMGLIQSRVSYHMKELVDAGVVNEEPKGKWKFYSLNREVLWEYLEKLRNDFSL